MIKAYIPVFLGSSRTGRQSRKVAQFFLEQLRLGDRVQRKVIDLREYKLPILEERLNEMSNPGAAVLQFCSKLSQADGVLIVTPEYKGGYPGVYTGYD